MPTFWAYSPAIPEISWYRSWFLANKIRCVKYPIGARGTVYNPLANLLLASLAKRLTWNGCGLARSVGVITSSAQCPSGAHQTPCFLCIKLRIRWITKKNTISKIAFCAWFIWPWKVKGQKKNYRLCPPWSLTCMSKIMTDKVCKKKIDLWPLTLVGQIS